MANNINKQRLLTYADINGDNDFPYFKNDIERIKSWGYELIKHDFSTVDLFGDYGSRLTATITNYKDWHFCDRSKTNAEIVLDFYKLLREEAGDILLIGCNTVSHLGAGIFELARTGDDTSAREWTRTPKMGVNTLAFRLPQNEAFYMVDKSRSRSKNGAGLGLALCTEILKLHNTELLIDSKLGEGSCFGFLLQYEGVMASEKVESESLVTEEAKP